MTRISGEIPQLTGLRAVAALMVLLHHLDSVFGNILSPHLSPVEQGFLGVDIFFVLSGFILSHVYAQTVTTSRAAYGVFLWRRFARIYPLHLATLLALVAMVAARGLLNTNYWVVGELPRHLLLLQAWTAELTWNLPSWSISAEWAAYVAFPVAVVLILRPSRPLVPILIVAALLVCFQIFGIAQVGLWRSWLGWPAATRIAAEFTLGVFAFRCVGSLRPSIWSDVVAAIAFYLAFMLPVSLLQVAAIGIAVPAVATSAGYVRRLLASRVFVALGVISYAIYMVHFPAIKVIQNVNEKLGLGSAAPAANLFFLGFWLAGVLLLAAAAYRFIERPARAWCRAREERLFAGKTGVAS